MSNLEIDPGKYSAIVTPVVEDGTVFYEARLREFGQGLLATGDTPSEAINNLYGDATSFLEDIVESGQSLPDPFGEYPWEAYSGKITLRLPKSLHYKLHVLAEEENISLNYVAVSILSWGAERVHCHIRPLTPMQLNVGFNQLVMNTGDLNSPPVATLSWIKRLEDRAKKPAAHV
jgi:predicted HicB family RNase H-like nuclease